MVIIYNTRQTPCPYHRIYTASALMYDTHGQGVFHLSTTYAFYLAMHTCHVCVVCNCPLTTNSNTTYGVTTIAQLC